MVSLRTVALAMGVLAAAPVMAQQPMMLARTPTSTIDNFARQNTTIRAHADLFSRLSSLNPATAENYNNSGKPQEALSYLAPTMDYIFQPPRPGTTEPRYSTTELRSLLDEPQRVKLAHALNEYGMGFLGQGKLDFAEPQFLRGIELEPSEILHNNLGLLYSKTNRFNLAITQYQRAISIDPNFGSAYYNLGAVLFKSGRLDDSLGAYKKSRSLNHNISKCDQAISYISKRLKL